MKFHNIRIQNYKSINDITLYLSDVNLLIGPNNSGKSNILSALKLFSDYIYSLNYDEYPKDSELKKELYFNEEKANNSIYAIIFNITYTYENLFFSLCIRISPNLEDKKKEHLISRLFYISEFIIENPISNMQSLLEKSEFLEVDGFHIEEIKKVFTSQRSSIFKQKVETYKRPGIDFGNLIQQFSFLLSESFSSSSIYSIQVEKLKAPARLTANEESVLPDGSNLVSFIDSMRDTNPKIIREIEKDLFRFTKEFESIRLIKVTGDSTTDATFKKLGLADKDDNTFWSDQLSEGVLYFLALLAIIHQPNPPHLLMLEEPEKGIHPRRIKEIIELIFQIAKDKGIRVILTTHSTYVVDQFTEIPEGVHIVDKIDKSTQVKNLKRDFIDKEEGREDKIDYLSSLGEHWSIGFLGGVPE